MKVSFLLFFCQMKQKTIFLSMSNKVSWRIWRLIDQFLAPKGSFSVHRYTTVFMGNSKIWKNFRIYPFMVSLNSILFCIASGSRNKFNLTVALESQNNISRICEWSYMVSKLWKNLGWSKMTGYICFIDMRLVLNVFIKVRYVHEIQKYFTHTCWIFCL